MNNDTQAYFYLPSELFTKDYSDFSNESKLLFGMLLTNMTTAKAVMVIYSNGMIRLLESLFPNKHNNLTAKRSSSI